MNKENIIIITTTTRLSLLFFPDGVKFETVAGNF